MLRPGRNIAIKVPLYRYEETVAFYRDRVGLPVTRTMANSTGFGFGELTLWIDRVPQQSQPDVWLELFSDTPTEALARLGSPQRDELEPLDGVTGHWTSDPAGTVLLVRKEGTEPVAERELSAPARIAAAVAALPLRPEMRVLEVGCGPGVALRLVAARVGDGLVLGIDRSAAAISQAERGCAAEIAAGRIQLQRTAIEDFVLALGEAPYDLAFGLRVGALDVRHPVAGDAALVRLAAALRPDGRLFVDGGDRLREVMLPRL